MHTTNGGLFFQDLPTSQMPMQILAFFVPTMLAAFVGSTSYGAEVVCDIESWDETHQLRILPSHDLYAFTKVDLPSGFRFSAQYLPALNKLKTYTYYASKERYVLVHVQEQVLVDKSCGQGFGANQVYSSTLEQDVLFMCTLTCE